MSNHTDEEIRAAYEIVAKRAISHMPDDLIAELHKPPIHPKVPVVRRYQTSGFGYLCFAKDLQSENSQRVVALIPADSVRNVVKRILSATVMPEDDERAMTILNEWIADYTKNGPGRDDVDYEVVDN